MRSPSWLSDECGKKACGGHGTHFAFNTNQSGISLCCTQYEILVLQNKLKLNHIEHYKSGVTDIISDKAVVSAEDGLVFLNSY